MDREWLSLDGEWQFWTDQAGTLAHDALGESARKVAVPAPWQSQADDLHDYAGIAWYRRNVELPAGWLGEGRAIVLRFGAVDYFADVWVNGTKVGEHEGGYLPFEFDIAGAARAGANEIVVRVADEQSYFPEIPHGKQSWYGPLSRLVAIGHGRFAAGAAYSLAAHHAVWRAGECGCVAQPAAGRR